MSTDQTQYIPTVDDVAAQPAPASTVAHAITCGCGFTASSDDPDVVSELLAEHTDGGCPNMPAAHPDTWWSVLVDNVFSLNGIVVVGILALAVMAIFGGDR